MQLFLTSQSRSTTVSSEAAGCTATSVLLPAKHHANSAFPRRHHEHYATAYVYECRNATLQTTKMACSMVLFPLGGVLAFSHTHWNGQTMPATVSLCNTLTADCTTMFGLENQQYTPTPTARCCNALTR